MHSNLHCNLSHTRDSPWNRLLRRASTVRKLPPSTRGSITPSALKAKCHYYYYSIFSFSGCRGERRGERYSSPGCLHFSHHPFCHVKITSNDRWFSFKRIPLHPFFIFICFGTKKKPQKCVITRCSFILQWFYNFKKKIITMKIRTYKWWLSHVSRLGVEIHSLVYFWWALFPRHTRLHRKIGRRMAMRTFSF